MATANGNTGAYLKSAPLTGAPSHNLFLVEQEVQHAA